MTCATCNTYVTSDPTETEDFNAWVVYCDDGESRCGDCADKRRKAERKARRAARLATVEG